MITFKTEFYSNIDMFDDIALQMLKMMGHSPSVPGAILADDVPQALANLKLAVAVESSQGAQSGSQADDEEDIAQRPVSVHNRAFPLIELLAAAAAKRSDVMWEKTSQFFSK